MVGLGCLYKIVLQQCWNLIFSLIFLIFMYSSDCTKTTQVMRGKEMFLGNSLLGVQKGWLVKQHLDVWISQKHLSVMCTWRDAPETSYSKMNVSRKIEWVLIILNRALSRLIHFYHIIWISFSLPIFTKFFWLSSSVLLERVVCLWLFVWLWGVYFGESFTYLSCAFLSFSFLWPSLSVGSSLLLGGT